MTPYPSKLDVVIVGGSLAGLWAAIAIKSLPNVTSVTILERFQEQQLQDLGAGIRLSPEAADAILAFTQTPPEKYAARMHAFRTLEHNGKMSADIPVLSWTSTWAQLFRVFKQAFDDDAKCLYQYGCCLSSLNERDKDHMIVTYTKDDQTQYTVSAQVVIGADGASSKVRSLVLPEVQRTSVGYALYRGLVPKSQLSESALKVFYKAASFSWPIDSQFLSYNVPANDAPADEAEVLVNWGWYQNKTENELNQLLLDKGGHRHLFSLPVGGMRLEEIEKIRAKAQIDLPYQHAEVVAKTKEPFLQVITDALSDRNCFYNGKLLLVGDAVGGQRPHTATALTQCAFHAILTRKLLDGDIDCDKWSLETYGFSTVLVIKGQEMGKLLLSTMLAQEKVPRYGKLIASTLAEVSRRWNECIGPMSSTA